MLAQLFDEYRVSHRSFFCGCLFLRQVKKLNIKKVDDKPMVIHTKEKTKIHVKSQPETKSRAEMYWWWKRRDLW